MANRALAAPGRRFFEALAAAPQRLLMLDYDGTLAPFVAQRHKAVPYPGVPEAIAAIMKGGGSRVAIVTGRALAELDALLGLRPPPEVWASHGWERRGADGTYRLFPLSEQAQRGLDRALAAAKGAGVGEGCELKPASVALHWRGLSSEAARDLEARAKSLWGPLSAQHGLSLAPFDGGLELRVPGRDKGTAVRAMLEGCPPGTVAAYLGDDLTDEDAFRALPSSGLGVLVRARARPTAASAWLCPPQGLLAFLRRWAAVTAGAS